MFKFKELKLRKFLHFQKKLKVKNRIQTSFSKVSEAHLISPL